MALPSNDRIFFLRSIAGLVSVVLTTVIRCAAGAILHLLMVWMLLPEEFGVYVFALLCAHAFIALSHLGVKKFVVQTESEHAIADAFKVQCTLSWIVWVVAMLSANSVGAFIGSQQGTLLFRIFATQLIFLPITFGYQGIAERDARHDLSQRANRLGIYAELSIGVIALRLGYGALGVAFAITCRSLIEAATLVITLGPRHLRLRHSRLDMEHAKTFLKFGLPMLASGFLVFGYWNVDDIFVGRILGEEQLGLYAFAFRFPHYLTLLSAALVTVSLPVLARLRNDDTQTERVFAVLTRVTAYGMGLCVILCLLYGEQLIQLIFGDAWLPALVPFQIFVVVVSC
ncbi:MAG: oligosaccharide flippase family protein, partial [Kiritimatiellae bacterium]|nr:oligosaccharide flippase family protein [Kiritimatiellia bacterium]